MNLKMNPQWNEKNENLHTKRSTDTEVGIIRENLAKGSSI